MPTATPTAKQLRSAGAKLRDAGLSEAASHLETHADVGDKAAAHAKLDKHVAKLDASELAEFNRSHVLEPAELALVQTEINVAPLLEGARVLITGDSPAAASARTLLDIADAREEVAT